MGTTAIVMAGAGARGAYEAGALSVLLPRLLPGEGGQERILLLGTSAGAINVVLLAAAADPAAATQVMVRLWESTGTGDVVAGLRGTAIRNLTSYLAGQFGHGQMTSLLDTAPLRRTMDTRLDWQQLRDRLDSGEGWAHGAAVVTTSASSGRTTVFLQGQGLTTPPPDDVRGIDYVPAALAAPHVMASAAIPVLFPPVRIGQPARDNVFTDGGVRLNAPIKPALALGADRVIVVATTPDPDTFAPPATPAVPDVFGAAGIVLRSLLQDRMAEDIRTLRKTNRFVAAGQDAGAPPLARPGTGEPYRLIRTCSSGHPGPASSAPQRTNSSPASTAACRAGFPIWESWAPCSAGPAPAAMANC